MESSQTPKPPTISLWRNVLYAWKKLKAVEGPAYFVSVKPTTDLRKALQYETILPYSSG